MKKNDTPRERRSGELSRRGFLVATGAASLVPALGRAEERDAPGPTAAILGPGRVPLEFELNGKRTRIEVEPRETLADVLLYRLNATGTKIACDRGACGACTVLVDGRTRASCMTPAIDVADKKVTTIEGLAEADGSLSPMQKAFIACDGLQCGYCTPGFVVSATTLVRDDPAPSRERVLEALSGNLCRCGSHPHIVEAVMTATQKKAAP